MKRKFFIVALIVLAIVLGFFRDYIFVSINQLIETGQDVSGHYAILKWVLTGLFSLLYMGITCTLLFFLFQSKKYAWVGISAYTLLIVVAGLVGGVGVVVISFEKIYPFVRSILGFVQSPVVMMILVPACFLNEAKVFNKN